MTAQNFCGECGGRLIPEAKFCGGCGAKTSTPTKTNSSKAVVLTEENYETRFEDRLINDVVTEFKPVYGAKYDPTLDCENCGSKIGNSLKCKVCGFEYELA